MLKKTCCRLRLRKAVVVAAFAMAAAAHAAMPQPSSVDASAVAAAVAAPSGGAAPAPAAWRVEKGPEWSRDEARWSNKDMLTGVSVVLALLALVFSAYTRWRTANQAYYAHLSRVWYDLRREESRTPEWMDPNWASMYGLPPSFPPVAYDAHAWSCWALAEDWYETYGRPKFSHRLTRSRGFKALFPNELSQFEGAVRNVTELHWAWLQRPDHRCRFDPDFLDWIRTRFLYSRVAVMPDGAIDGQGLQARDDLKAGQFVGFLDGEAVERPGTHTLQLDERLHLLLNEPMRYLNHAPRANAVIRGRSLFAARDIAAGEEITIDYTCTEDRFLLEAGGPVMGYAMLSAEERAERKDRLHGWLLAREKRRASEPDSRAV